MTSYSHDVIIMTIASHHNIMWSQSTDVKDGRTDRQTIYRSNTAL